MGVGESMGLRAAPVRLQGAAILNHCKAGMAWWVRVGSQLDWAEKESSLWQAFSVKIPI